MGTESPPIPQTGVGRYNAAREQNNQKLIYRQQTTIHPLKCFKIKWAAETRNMLIIEVMLFEHVMQQFYFQKQFDCKCYLITTINFRYIIEVLMNNSQS